MEHGRASSMLCSRSGDYKTASYCTAEQIAHSWAVTADMEEHQPNEWARQMSLCR